MAGKQNEVEVDVGMDVQSEAITRAFNQIDARIKRVQQEMAKVGQTSIDAAKNFKTEINGVMAGFNKNLATLEKFEKNINGPQRRQMQDWDREEAAANRLANEKRKLRAQARKDDDAAARRRLAEIDRDERAANQLAETKKKFRDRERKDAAAAEKATLATIDREETAANKLADQKKKLRDKERKDEASARRAREKDLERDETAANKLAEQKKKLRDKERTTATGDAVSDARPDRNLDKRSLQFELNASRDLLDLGGRRAYTQARINEAILRRQTLTGAERRRENEAIQHEIARLRLIDQRIAKVRAENIAQDRASRAPTGSGGTGGGGLFGNAGIMGVFARTAGYGAAAAAIYGSVAALRDGITFSIQYEDALARLGAIAGTTSTQLAELDKRIQGVAKNSRFSTLELTEAATVLAQAGFTQQEIEGSLASISQLATAAGVTIAEATDVATSAIGAFQLQASETAHINDVLASALNNTKLNIQQVALGIQYAGATAHENNITFEELTATMAVMANAGIRSGSTIGTGIRQFLVDIQTPTEKLTEKLTALGLTLADVDVGRLGLPEVLNRMAAAGFDSAAAYGSLETRAAAAYLVLRNNRQEIQEQIIAQTQVGQAAEAAAKGQESLAAEWQRSKNILNGYVDKAVRPASEAIRKLLRDMNDQEADPVLAKLWGNYNSAETRKAQAAAFEALKAYRLGKEALVEIEDKHSASIERSNTLVNDFTNKVGQQRTKLASLDEAIARVHVRRDALSKGGLALSAETATLTTRFQGLASKLDTTAGSYNNLTSALQAYRLEQLGLIQQNLQSQEIALRVQSGNYNSRATSTLASMKQNGTFQSLPADIRELIETVRKNPGSDNARRQLMDRAGGLEGNSKRFVDSWLLSIDRAVTAKRGETRAKSDGATVEALLGPTGRRLQAQVSALPGQSDAAIKAVIAQLTKSMGSVTNPAGKRAYATLIEQAQTYLGSGPRVATPEKSGGSKAEPKPEIQFGSPVRGPVNVRSGVGPRARPALTNGGRGSSNHQGVDIAGKVGDPVLATADGYVLKAKEQKTGYGKYIILDHGAGTTTLYAHLSEILVTEGQEVLRGDIIGKVGATGGVTGAHLHYERKTSKGVDKTPLKGNAPGALSEIATGAARVQEQAREEEEKRFERNETALQRMRVSNAEANLRGDLDDLKDNTGGLAEDVLRAQVEGSFKAWEDALRDQLIAEDDRRDATDQERLEHLEELRDRIKQKREEVEDAFFQAFLGGLEGSLETFRQQWASQDASKQQAVAIAQARMAGLQAPRNRGRVPGYVIGYQQQQIERAEQDYRKYRLGSLPGQINELDAKRQVLFDRSMTDPTLNPNELKEAADRMRVLREEAAELRREFELLNAEEKAVAPKGFGDNARMWLDDWRERNDLKDGLGWGDMFEGLDGVLDTAKGSMGQFFSDVINGTKSVGEAFGDMKDAVLQALGDMIAQMLAKQIFKWLTQLATTIIGGPPVTKFHGGEVRAFTGRYITSGVPNRDSVSARIAKGEYVVRKSAVDSVGVDFMDRLNERGSHALKSMAPKPLIVPRAEQKMNVYVVAPEQRPQMGPNDVLVTIANDIASGGQTKQLIKHIAQGG